MTVWVTLKEAAKVAGRTERTIRNWVAAGELTPRYRLFDRDDVLASEQRMRRRIGRPPSGKGKAFPEARGESG
jgi:predicted transcriptional regulator